MFEDYEVNNSDIVAPNKRGSKLNNELDNYNTKNQNPRQVNIKNPFFETNQSKMYNREEE